MIAPSHHTLETIWGHEATKALVVRLMEQRRLPHALLLSGADGVGKRSLAFALAKTILSAGLRKRATPPAVTSTLRAPAPPRMRVSLDRLPRVLHAPDDDLFGGMDDLFAAETEPPKPKPAAKVKQELEAAPPPADDKPAKKPRANKRAAAATEPALDERTPLPAVIAPGHATATVDATPVPIAKAAAPAPLPSGVDPVLIVPKVPMVPDGQHGLDGGMRQDEASLFGDELPADEPVAPPPTWEAPVDTSTDERVNKLVSKAYPVEYTSDERPMMQGHVDLTIIEPIGKSKSIKIDQVRVMQDTAMLPPLEGRFRVILVFGADTITLGAANSLLKLMEEPPSWLVLILVTDHYHRVLETIRSRCASLVCAALPKDDLVDKLVQQERIEPGLARVAASIAEGRPGRALELVAGKALKARHEVFEARLNVDRVGPAAMPLACARALNATGSLGAAALMLMALARDRLVRQLAPEQPELLINGDLAALYEGLAVDEALLHEEAERLLEALAMEDHPAVPAPMVPLQLALWG